MEESTAVRRRRRILMPVTALGSLFLVPWSVYMALELPRHYVAQRWDATWVGFDLVLAVALGVTAFLVWKRRLLAVVTAGVAGTMLLVDAWFDVMTARDPDQASSISSAVLEVPMGVLLLVAASSIAVRAAHLLEPAGDSGGWWKVGMHGADTPEEDDQRVISPGVPDGSSD